MSVDLPAPFSPTIAWIDPGRTERSMPSFATTPGNRLTIAFSSIAGGSERPDALEGAVRRCGGALCVLGHGTVLYYIWLGDPREPWER